VQDAMRSGAAVWPALKRGDTAAAVGAGLSGAASAAMALGVGAGKEAKLAEIVEGAAPKITIERAERVPAGTPIVLGPAGTDQRIYVARSGGQDIGARSGSAVGSPRGRRPPAVAAAAPAKPTRQVLWEIGKSWAPPGTVNVIDFISISRLP
jgi:hypothetical protein